MRRCSAPRSWSPSSRRRRSAADSSGVTFGEPEASSKYAERIEFVQPVALDRAIDRAEVRLTFADSSSPLVVEMPGLPAGNQSMRYSFDFTEGGHLYPNTRITARWRVYDSPEDRTGTDGPPVTLTYEDDRFDWKVLEGDLVRVHWYDGDQAFGRSILEMGEKAVRETSELLGVTEEEPIDFYIYADPQAFYGALDPSTQENVGGQALPRSARSSPRSPRAAPMMPRSVASCRTSSSTSCSTRRSRTRTTSRRAG